jgi:hypothetical protein
LLAVGSRRNVWSTLRSFGGREGIGGFGDLWKDAREGPLFFDSS